VKTVSNGIKKMADLLRLGATMLSDSCPKCNSPLFRLTTGEVYCANCNRKVVIVKEGEETSDAVTPPTLAALEETILLRLQEIERKIKNNRPERLHTTVNLANTLLDALEKVRKIRKVR
jgi:UPF0148 protein